MIQIINNQNNTEQASIFKLLDRSQLEFKNVQNIVDDIIKNVKEKKDEALFAYANLIR
jgi:histidinol dehydrogenase